MVSDTADASLGRACEATIEQWRETLRDLIPDEQYTFAAVSTKDWGADATKITSESVEGFLRELRDAAGREGGIAREDTLVCLYHGHGGRGILGDHYLRLSTGEWMYSSALQNAVKAVPCRLKVIMTCSCNTGLFDRLFFAPALREWNAAENGIAPIMKSLFLDHSGLLHMNAAWPGHYSYSTTGPEGANLGSWFFDSFLMYCRANPELRPSWRDVDSMLDTELTKRFKEAKAKGSISRQHGNIITRQDHANPVTWSFPKQGR